MYNPKSSKAKEFISHEEVLETLEFAEKNKNNAKLVGEIIEKAKLRKGLTHREASVLLACELPGKNEEVLALAKRIKTIFMATAWYCSLRCTCPTIV